MPIHSIQLNEIEQGTGRKFMRICLSSNNCLTLYYNTLPNPKGQKQLIIQSTFQDFFDVRQPISGLPLDDPDLTTDPNRKSLFYDGTDLVGRSVKVAKVVWENATDGIEEFELERVEDD